MSQDTTTMVIEKDIEKIGLLLRDRERPLKERFRALFTLRNLGGEASISQISSCFSDPSALLKHELAYCLGQMGDKKAIPTLIKVLEDTNQEPMVRHEAGEALGAIGCSSVKAVLKEYSTDPVIEVAETCQLALGRINWLQNEEDRSEPVSGTTFQSIDPTPPSRETNIGKLKATLINEELPLFERYKAMFALRNLNTAESAKALASGFKCSSALFRHEVGYVLGQMACEEVVQELSEVVRDHNESGMVRHEAAEALGSIANEEAVKVLKEFLYDDVIVVKESCQVALDMSEYENSSEFQYADGLQKISLNDS